MTQPVTYRLPRLRIGVSVLALTLLGACQTVSGLFGSSSPAPEPKLAGPRNAAPTEAESVTNETAQQITVPYFLADGLTPTAYRDAICGGAPEAALAEVPPGYRTRPDAMLLAAYAFERLGNVVGARPLYSQLASSRASQTMSMSCGGLVMFDGPITMIAQDRLRDLTRQLVMLDADFSQEKPLHAGLPSRDPDPIDYAPQPVNTGASNDNISTPSASNETPAQPSGVTITKGTGTATAANTAEKETQTTSDTVAEEKHMSDMGHDGHIMPPATLDPLGRWFIHLASFTSQENARTGQQVLVNEHPSLDGYFDSWQIDIRGERTWRVGLRVNDRDEATEFCNHLKDLDQYCAVLDSGNFAN